MQMKNPKDSDLFLQFQINTNHASNVVLVCSFYTKQILYTLNISYQFRQMFALNISTIKQPYTRIKPALDGTPD